MEISTSIVIQVVAISLALLVTILRGWVRIGLEHRALTTPDYLVWCGWLSSLGWFICSIKALNIGKEHPVDPETGATDSVEYLKTVFISCYFFDVGLYWPKASIVVFYWWLIPKGFKLLRMALYLTTGSLENQLKSTWNSMTGFTINWALNISTDLSLFCLPFFVISSLKLHRRQRIGLIGVFSLGLITILISTARFMAYIITDYQLDDASGNAWCTIEMSTAVIVVSLPGLKSLLVRVTSPSNTADRSTNAYAHTSSRQPSGNRAFASRAVAQDNGFDDELELIRYGQNSSAAEVGAMDDAGNRFIKEAVVVTKDFTVAREVS
ncbi:hypothetical protein FLONG3_547 [Fusarium longipes]|uniref:Rhodopsin domain-containing protein n=1 Tax=Fusarium longipes TaxID=694270 RepID=A0A395T9P2_9HYPO|nr:hypothetical protein FLONG3_547 [Fusarium longipes]